MKTLVNCLWFKKDIHEAISMPRLHHQLYPEFLFAETRFPITVLHELEKYGHKVCRNNLQKISELCHIARVITRIQKVKPKMAEFEEL